MAQEESYLCPECGKMAMVKRETKPRWHVLICLSCGAQTDPLRERSQPIDVA